MIASKPQFLKAAVATLAALPVAAAGVFTSADSAQAAALKGSFFLIGDGLASFANNGDSLNFLAPNTFTINPAASSGSFTTFTSGTVGNIISFLADTATNPFVDLGGGNTFTVTSASYVVGGTPTSTLSPIDVTVRGFFTSSTGDLSGGEGLLTLQAIGSKPAVEAAIASNLLPGVTYSGVYLATVPEPATMLGLGVVGAAMFAANRRKKVAQ
ncbi:PEP-CTERM putative exosortase interaction domain-containing protein [Nostoc sp. PCC 7524]|nr:PEP-CTERM putative exosortase interaction domain-containing protein [Nostoc sp. PCC 7524]